MLEDDLANMGMQTAANQVIAWLAELDFSTLHGRDAVAMSKALSEVIGSAQAALGRCGIRAEATKAYREVGARDTQGVLAATGMTRTDAVNILTTAKVLDESTHARRLFRLGRFSQAKASVLATGMSHAPEREAHLVGLATHDSLAMLQDATRRLEGPGEQALRDSRRAQNQCVRIFPGEDGMTKLFCVLPPEVAKDVIAELRTRDDAVFRNDRRTGRRRSSHQRMVESLHDLVIDARKCRLGVQGSEMPNRRRSRHDALVLVNLESLVRGHREHDEVCEINGIGEISVQSACALLGESLFRLVVRDGVELRTATSPTRAWRSVVRDVMDLRWSRCGIQGCDAKLGLERHHIEPYATGGPTNLANGVRLCHYHHDLLTHRKFSLHEHAPGRWRLLAPGELALSCDQEVHDTG